MSIRTTGKYILNQKVVTACDDLMTWAIWIETERDQQQVGLTRLDETIHISTVFLGIDYSYGRSNPKFFETMIFGGIHDGYTKRYSTYEEAEDGHKEAVRLAQSNLYAQN